MQLFQKAALLLVIFCHVVLRVSAGAGFAWINDALRGVVFLRNSDSGQSEVGPCQNNDRCVFDYENAPEYVRGIESSVPILGTRRVDEFIKYGVAKVWNLQCSDLEFRDIKIKHEPIESNKRNRLGDNVDEMNLNVVARNTQLRCLADVQLINVGFILLDWGLLEIVIPINIDILRTEFGDGLGASFNLRFTPTNGRSNIVGNGVAVYDGGVARGGDDSWGYNFIRATEFLQFPWSSSDPEISLGPLIGASRAACAIFIPWGSISIARDWGFAGEILMGILGFFIGLFNGIICGFIAGTANLQVTNVNYNEYGQLGLLNLYFNDLNKIVNDAQATVINTDLDVFREQERALIRAHRNTIEIEKAINFQNDDIYRGLEKVLNDVFGAVSEDPTLNDPYKLVINEAMNGLTDDTGRFGFTDLVESFTALKTYPTTTLKSKFLHLKLELKGFEFSGLNTFSRFKVLENPQMKYRYSLRHQLSIGNFGYSFTIGLVLDAGEYVTSNRGTGKFGLPSPQRTIKIRGSLGQVDINATTFMMIQPERLKSVQVGQLFGETAKANDTFAAMLYILDHFNIMGLDPKVESFGSLNLDEVENAFGSEIIDLVEEGFRTFKAMFTGGLRENIGVLIENRFREQINEYLEPNFVDSLIYLEPYEGTGAGDCYGDIDDILNTPCFFDFEKVAFGGFEGVTNIVNKLLGGEKVKEGGADINTLINAALEYIIIENPEELDIDGPEVLETPLLYLGPGKLKLGADVDVEFITAGGLDEFRFFIGGPVVSNIDQVARLEVFNGFDPKFEIKFDIAHGYGLITNKDDVDYNAEPLTIEIPIVFYSRTQEGVRADEKFNISLAVAVRIEGTIQGQINRQRFFVSTFNDLVHLRCIFASLRRRGLSNFNITIDTFDLTLPIAPDSSTTTDIAGHLVDFDQEITDNPILVEHMLQYFLDQFVDEAVRIFNLPFNTTTGYAYELLNCTTLPSPLEGGPLNEPLPDIKLSEINEFLVESTLPQANPRNLGVSPRIFEDLLVPDGEIAFDLTNERNGFINAFSNTLTVNTVKNLMVEFGNTTIDPNSNLTGLLDPIVDALRLEDDGSVSFVYDFGVKQGLNYAGGLIKGLEVNFYPLVITNIDKLTEVTLLKPYVSGGEKSRFTTESTFTYSDSAVLTVSFGAEIKVDGEVLDRAAEGIITENIEVKLEISAFDIQLLTTMAVDANILNSTKMDLLLEYNETSMEFGVRNEAINCSIPKMIFPNGFQFQQLQFVFAENDNSGINGPFTNVTGEIFSPALTGIIDSMLDIIFEVLSKQMGNVSQGPIRKKVNEIIDEFLDVRFKKECIPPAPRPPGKILFPFNKAPLSGQLRDFVSNDLFNPNSPLQIDNVLRAIDTFLEENEDAVTYVFNKTKLPEYNDIDLGGFTFLAGAIRLPGVGSSFTVSELEILDNSKFLGQDTPYRTRSRIKFSGPATSSARLGFSFEPNKIFGEKETRRRLGPVNLIPYTSGLTNDLEFELSLEDFELSMDMDILVEVNSMMGLVVGNILNVYNAPLTTPCFLSIFDEKGLVPQSVNITFAPNGANVGLKCVGVCNSQAFDSLTLGVPISTDSEISKTLSILLADAIQIIKLLVSRSDAQEYLNLAIKTSKVECIEFDTTFKLPEVSHGINAALYMLYSYLCFMFVMVVYGCGWQQSITPRKID